ncbi:uncharacterized protein LOC124167640 [Ischnura elegans]|uniref:uncharacterized protein LOC124167640 n=1 Tax=Ischnura elegans TaxID=197161 RepID=UPI001ED8BE96|nr:uncharacterized protein LOC124167640 [Ischnura elegans]
MFQPQQIKSDGDGAGGRRGGNVRHRRESIWFLYTSSAVLLLLFPTIAFATTSGALGMGEVYSVEDPYPSEGPPHFSDPHDVGPDGTFGGWLTPLFGTADEEKRDTESLERVFLQSGCWNTTEDGKEMEVECRCSGDDILDIPGNLTKDVSRISIVRAGLVTLRRGVLQPYAATLKDLVLMNVDDLESIEDHAFENLTELRTIYIDHAPKLRNISDSVFGDHLPRLRILRIVHTGLNKIPNFSDLRVDAIIHMIDLENNQIERVYSNSVKVRSEQL